MTLREVLSELYQEIGMSPREIDVATRETQARSVALFGKDVGSQDLTEQDTERMKEFVLGVLSDPRKWVEARRRAMKFELENRVDGARN